MRLPSNRQLRRTRARCIPAIAFCDAKGIEMKAATSKLQVLRRCVGMGVVVLACAQTLTVAAQDRGDKLRRFEADRKACLDGKSGQVVEACMKEAGAVLAQRPDASPPVSTEQLQRNTMMRCEAQTGEDRTACVARMRGEGTASGSVSGGGILRELVTVDGVPTSPPKPPSADVAK
jgi:hypothetical protein